MSDTNNIQSFKNTISSTMYIIKLIWKHDKKYIIITTLISVINAVVPLVYTVFPGLIINELTADKQIDRLIIMVGILSVTPVILFITNSCLNKYKTKINMKINMELATDFYEQILKMDYELLENPEIQTQKERATEVNNDLINIVSLVIVFFSSIISILALSSIIVMLNPLVIVLLVLIIIINSKATKWLNNQQYIEGKKISHNERVLWGFLYTMDNFHFAKEVRIFGIKDLLLNKINQNKANTNAITLNLLSKQRKAGLVSTLTGFIQQVGLYAYLIFLIITGKINVGTMTIYLNSIVQFSGAFNNIVNNYLTLASNSLKVQEYIDFMNIPLHQYNSGNIKPVFKEDLVIEFINVSFKYPGSDRFALKNLNIKISGKERICIVGENGSGKSTFIKLLTRLYTPSEGEILLNGINIMKYDMQEYQRLFSPVFQDYCRFYLSLGENIALTENADDKKLDKVCNDSGLLKLVKKLTKGYDTQVDKWIDPEGFEPSGGEDQRIAIARALYRGGSIYLLDEPTAALDPIAEYEIYTQFHNMIQGKTAILITHRLSAVQLADKVAVFDDGHVAEYGTHTELYEKGGIYTEMFDKQAQFYRDAPAESAEAEE